MEEIEILKEILNSYPYFIVFVDNDYIIRFMNKPAQDHYLKKGKNLIGKSIFDCHNEKSIEKIKKNVDYVHPQELSNQCTKNYLENKAREEEKQKKKQSKNKKKTLLYQ